MKRVLIVDDEAQILRALRVVLREADFEVIPATDVAEALDSASLHPPDAAIIDLVLPDGDGIEITKELRKWTQAPIIVLSAIGEEEQKVRALEAGADDYITKPFAPRELVARLNAALRRAPGETDSPVLKSGDLTLDVSSRQVLANRDEIHLTPLEFKLLETLMRNSGRLMTHGALLTEVWGPAYAKDTGTLRTHMSNLRSKIGDGYIHTDPGVGYRLK